MCQPRTLFRPTLEKRNLAFEIRLVIKKTVPLNAASGDTFYLVDFEDRILSCRLSEVPNIVVVGRDVEVLNLHPEN